MPGAAEKTMGCRHLLPDLRRGVLAKLSEAASPKTNGKIAMFNGKTIGKPWENASFPWDLMGYKPI